MRVWNQLHVLALLRVLFLSSTSPSSSSLLCYPFIWNIHWGQMQNCHPAVYLLKQIQSLTRFMNKSLKRQWQWAINWNNEVFLPFLKLYVYDKKYFNGTSLSRMIKNSRGINEKDHHFHIFHVSLKITLTVNCAKKKKVECDSGVINGRSVAEDGKPYFFWIYDNVSELKKTYFFAKVI